MAEKRNPGALAGATGAGKPCHATAVGIRTIATDTPGGNALAHHFAFLAASLDPATLAALGLACARIAGLMTWGASDG